MTLLFLVIISAIDEFIDIFKSQAVIARLHDSNLVRVKSKGTAQDTNMLITNSAYIRFEYNSIEQKCGFRKNVSQKY